MFSFSQFRELPFPGLISIDKDPYYACNGWFEHSKIVNEGWLVHRSFNNGHKSMHQSDLVNTMNVAVAFITGNELNIEILDTDEEKSRSLVLSLVLIPVLSLL